LRVFLGCILSGMAFFLCLPAAAPAREAPRLDLENFQPVPVDEPAAEIRLLPHVEPPGTVPAPAINYGVMSVTRGNRIAFGEEGFNASLAPKNLWIQDGLKTGVPLMFDFNERQGESLFNFNAGINATGENELRARFTLPLTAPEKR
jgi:hypothetical protein